MFAACENRTGDTMLSASPVGQLPIRTVDDDCGFDMDDAGADVRVIGDVDAGGNGVDVDANGSGFDGCNRAVFGVGTTGKGAVSTLRSGLRTGRTLRGAAS